MTAVAVKFFDIDWTLKIVSVVTGAAPPRSRWPKPSLQSASSPSTTATARPGHVLLRHQLRDPRPIPGDDGRGPVVGRRHHGRVRGNGADEAAGAQECRGHGDGP